MFLNHLLYSIRDSALKNKKTILIIAISAGLGPETGLFSCIYIKSFAQKNTFLLHIPIL